MSPDAEAPAARYAARLTYPDGGSVWLLVRHQLPGVAGAEAAALIREKKPPSEGALCSPAARRSRRARSDA